MLRRHSPENGVRPSKTTQPVFTEASDDLAIKNLIAYSLHVEDCDDFWALDAWRSGGHGGGFHASNPGPCIPDGYALPVLIGARMQKSLYNKTLIAPTTG